MRPARVTGNTARLLEIDDFVARMEERPVVRAEARRRESSAAGTEELLHAHRPGRQPTYYNQGAIHTRTDNQPTRVRHQS